MGQPRIERNATGTLWLVLDAPRLSIALTAEQAVQLSLDVAQAGVGVTGFLDGKPEDPTLPDIPDALGPRPDIPHLLGWTRVCDALPDDANRRIHVRYADCGEANEGESMRAYLWPGTGSTAKHYWRYAD